MGALGLEKVLGGCQNGPSQQGSNTSHLLQDNSWHFPTGPVAKTPSSHCRRPKFYPWSGNQIPHAATDPVCSTKTCGSQISRFFFFFFLMLALPSPLPLAYRQWGQPINAGSFLSIMVPWTASKQTLTFGNWVITSHLLPLTCFLSTAKTSLLLTLKLQVDLV